MRFAERQVGPDRDGGPFVPLGDDLEQQLGAAGVGLDVAEFVEQQEVQPAVAADRAGQRALVSVPAKWLDLCEPLPDWTNMAR